MRRRMMMNDAIVTEHGKELVLGNCKGSYLHGLNVFGRTEQVTTTGAQLLDVESGYRETINGITLDVDNSGIITVDGTCDTENTLFRIFQRIEHSGNEFTVSFEKISGTASGGCNFQLQPGLVYVSAVNSNNRTFTALDGISNAPNFRFDPGQTFENFKLRVMLNAGTTALSWEPYTGGQPSPSPDYPQELRNVGVKYPRNYFGFNKNVKLISNLNFDKENNGVIIKGLDAISNNRIYNLGFEGLSGYFTVSGKMSATNNVTVNINICANEKTSINVDNNYKYFKVTANVNEHNTSDNWGGFVDFDFVGQEITLYVSDLMIEYGDVATPWHPAPEDAEIAVELSGANLLADEAIPNNGGKNGITYFFDGSIITIDGTATDQCDIFFNLDYFKSLPAGEYAFGNPENRFGVYANVNDLHGGTNISSLSFPIYANDNDFRYVIIRIKAGNKYDNEKFTLMLNKGSVLKEYQRYVKPQHLTVSTPNGLPGIPVSSGGNYTDENGQQWICDEVDFKRCVYEQRIYSIVLDGSENLKFHKNADSGANYLIIRVPYPIIYSQNEMPMIISNYFIREIYKLGDAGKVCISTANNEIRLYFGTNPDMASLEAMQEFLVLKHQEGNPVTIYAVAETPIETPITPEELAAYKSLHTYTPTTVISNDADAWMSVMHRKVRKEDSPARTAVIPMFPGDEFVLSEPDEEKNENETSSKLEPKIWG